MVRHSERFRGTLLNKKGQLVSRSARRVDRLLRSLRTGKKTTMNRRLVKLLARTSAYFGHRAVILVSGYRPYSKNSTPATRATTTAKRSISALWASPTAPCSSTAAPSERRLRLLSQQRLRAHGCARPQDTMDRLLASRPEADLRTSAEEEAQAQPKATKVSLVVVDVDRLGTRTRTRAGPTGAAPVPAVTGGGRTGTGFTTGLAVGLAVALAVGNG